MTIDQTERYSRQADLVPADKLANAKVTVIGTGAIGRQVSLMLAAIGTPWIQLIDFDTVEEGNLAAQGFMEQDLGQAKVEAIAKMCKQINNEIEVISVSDRFRRSMQVGNIVFCCVDKIDIRQFIWEVIKNKVDLFIDGRMAAEALRVLVVHNKESSQYYDTTFFSPDEAYEGSCTAKSTIYSSNVIGGIMVGQFTKSLRGLPLDCDIQYNMLTNELDAKEIEDIQREAI